MYNHNKAQQNKNRVHISWDILYLLSGKSTLATIDTDIARKYSQDSKKLVPGLYVCRFQMGIKWVSSNQMQYEWNKHPVIVENGNTILKLPIILKGRKHFHLVSLSYQMIWLIFQYHANKYYSCTRTRIYQCRYMHFMHHYRIFKCSLHDAGCTPMIVS